MKSVRSKKKKKKKENISIANFNFSIRVGNLIELQNAMNWLLLLVLFFISFPRMHQW